MTLDHLASTDSPADFELGALLGEGSVAEVFRATHLPSGLTVALKVWRTPTSALTQDDRRRFLRECHVMRELSTHSQRLVRFRWSGLETDGRPWLAMDVHTESLQTLASRDRVDLQRGLALADDLLAGLAEVHAAGHVHRDVKPANVLLGDGRAYLGDFGIAMRSGGATRDVAAGTPGYVAPELHRGDEPTTRSDVYSAARTISEILPADLPRWLDNLLTRATSADPEDRPTDAAHFLAKLRSGRSHVLDLTAVDAASPVVVRVAEQDHPVPAHGRLIIGRGDDCDVQILDALTSRHHVIVEPRDGQWRVADLGSANGTWSDWARVDELPVVTPATTIRLGGPDGVTVSVRPVAAHGPESASSGLVPPGRPKGTRFLRRLDLVPGVLSVGRSKTNQLVLDDLLVSRRHAELTVSPGRVTVRDLSTANGTYLNGRAVSEGDVRQGDLVSIGSYLLYFDGRGLDVLDDGAGVELAARGLTVDVKGGRRLVADVSFDMPPSSLLAVVGPSGAGKSTLLGALSGLRPASSGTVSYAGRDLYDDYADLRRRIGFVPQQDILHQVLTVRQALDFGAALRFPPEVSDAERRGRIDEVLRELRLDEHAGTRIASLSGGQRKRASTALELLTKPSLLFLDEPTSGLDTDLDREVMHRLRALADDGRSVIVVTHNLEHLGVCDQVMVLAEGGHLAYVGPPGDAFSYFGVDSWADVFATLKERPAAHWGQQFASVRGPLTDALSATALNATRPPAEGPVTRASVPRWAQFRTLVRRQAGVIWADRTLVAILGALPVVLAGIARVIPADDGTARVVGNTEALQLLMVLVVGACLMGSAGSIRELVKERAIYRRERAVGLSSTAYLTSKLSVAAVVGAVQAAVLTALALVGRPHGTRGLVVGDQRVEIALVIALVTVVSAVVGLLVSAAVDDESQAMPLLVLTTMAQLVLCGGLTPIDGRVALEQLSWLLPSRWGLAATASTVDLTYMQGGGAAGDPLWSHDVGALLLSLTALVLIAVVAAAGARVLLSRLDPRR